MRTLPALLPLLLMTSTPAKTPDLPELQRMIARYAPVDLRADTSKLSPQDSQALAKLIAAAHLIDDLFLKQYWSGNPALYDRLLNDATPARGRGAYAERVSQEVPQPARRRFPFERLLRQRCGLDGSGRAPRHHHRAV